MNGKRFHADVCGENRARKKAFVCVDRGAYPMCGDYRVLRVVRGSTELYFSINYLCASVALLPDARRVSLLGLL